MNTKSMMYYLIIFLAAYAIFQVTFHNGTHLAALEVEYAEGKRLSGDQKQSLDSKKITIITLSSCSACQELKQFLTKQDIDFIEWQNDSINSAMQQKGKLFLSKLKLNAVPVIIINDVAYLGYSQKVKDALEKYSTKTTN